MKSVDENEIGESSEYREKLLKFSFVHHEYHSTVSVSEPDEVLIYLKRSELSAREKLNLDLGRAF